MTKTTLNQHQFQIIPIRTIIRFFKVQLQNNRAHMVREHDSSSPISIPKTKERFVLLGFHTFVLSFEGCRFPTTPLTGSSNDTLSCFAAPYKETKDNRKESDVVLLERTQIRESRRWEASKRQEHSTKRRKRSDACQIRINFAEPLRAELENGGEKNH